MSDIRQGDRCADCKHLKVWSTSRDKATCGLYHEEGFHPDRPAPSKCIGKVGRKY
jgi:hypothetical protein